MSYLDWKGEIGWTRSKGKSNWCLRPEKEQARSQRFCICLSDFCITYFSKMDLEYINKVVDNSSTPDRMCAAS